MYTVLEDAVIGLTFGWIVWVVFTSLRRYLIAKMKVRLQEKILDRINSSDAVSALAANDSGRHFLESITVEESQPPSPFGRILFGIQAGIALFFFGAAMLFLHHHVNDNGNGFIIIGTGAIGLGLGFLTASAASVFVSRKLGLISSESRG
jgi:PPE-repeat protein